MFGLVLAAGSLLLKGASAIANHNAQNKAKKANDIAAKDAFSQASRALSLRQEQEALAASQQVYQIGQATASQRGSLAASAASAGVGGNTVDVLDADLMRNEYSARDVVDRNLSMVDQQIEQQRKAAGAQMRGRISGVQGASNAATGIEIGGALASFGYDWLKLHPPAA